MIKVLFLYCPGFFLSKLFFIFCILDFGLLFINQVYTILIGKSGQDWIHFPIFVRGPIICIIFLIAIPSC